MARPRKRHVQTEMRFRHRDKNGQHRGGYRPNAGRKPNCQRAGASHAARPAVNPRHPQHVTLRVTPSVGWLRRLDMYEAVRNALRAVLPRVAEFRIVHFSLQNTHVHLIVEASGQKQLANGMRAFQISAAKRINAVYSRRRRIEHRGRVFTDRYHAEDLGSVRQVRNALAYVINNWRRHRDDAGTYRLLGGRLDPYASGLAFAGWRDALRAGAGVLPKDYEPPPMSDPRTWLLNEGWKRAKPIGMREIPGPRKILAVDA